MLGVSAWCDIWSGTRRFAAWDAVAARALQRLSYPAVVAVEERSEPVESPLHEAAKRGHLSLLTECLRHNVSVNGLDKAGNTPLHWAARGGHLECAEALLAAPNVAVNVQVRAACRTRTGRGTEHTPGRWLTTDSDGEIANSCAMK